MDKVLGTAAGAVVLGAVLAWQRALAGPSVVTTVGVVACAVVAVLSIGTAAVCALFELGSGPDHDK